MSELPGIITAICEGAMDRMEPGTLRAGVEEVRDRLSEPLRVAIAGRVSAGKSTLVNAMLGVPVAPTGAGETTRMVTWYRYAEQDRAVLSLRDGSRHSVPFDRHRSLPEELGTSWENVESLDVYLYSTLLRQMTVIDTPGLSSVTEGTSDRTERLLTERSQSGASTADALVYVVTRDAREDDASILQGFRGEKGGLTSSPVNSLVVLSKIDKLAGAIDDPFREAGTVMDRLRGDIGHLVHDVVPLMGLLAETAATGSLTEEHVRWLQLVVGPSASDHGRILLSARRFLAAPEVPLPLEARKALLARLDLYGVRRAVEMIRAGAAGAVALTHGLAETSGMQRLTKLLVEVFTDQTHLLRAAAAVRGLRALVDQYAAAEGATVLNDELRRSSDRLTLAADAQQLRELTLLHDLATGRLRLPDQLWTSAQDLLRGKTLAEKVGLGDGAAESSAEAVVFRRAAVWRAYGNAPQRSVWERQAAHTVGLAYARLLTDLQENALV